MESPNFLAPKRTIKYAFESIKRSWKINIRDSYLIPRMDEGIGCLGYFRIFTSPEWEWDYWKVEIWNNELQKKNFMPHHGVHAPYGYLYSWIMPFKRFNFWLTILSRRKMSILSDNLEKYFSIFDLIGGTNGSFWKFLMLIKETGLKLKLNNLKFFSDKINYLSNIIRPGICR